MGLRGGAATVREHIKEPRTTYEGKNGAHVACRFPNMTGIHMRNEVGKVGNTGLCKLYLSEVSCRFIFVLKKKHDQSRYLRVEYCIQGDILRSKDG